MVFLRPLRRISRDLERRNIPHRVNWHSMSAPSLSLSQKITASIHKHGGPEGNRSLVISHVEALPRKPGLMIPEIDIWCCAQVMILRHAIYGAQGNIRSADDQVLLSVAVKLARCVWSSIWLIIKTLFPASLIEHPRCQHSRSSIIINLS